MMTQSQHELGGGFVPLLLVNVMLDGVGGHGEDPFPWLPIELSRGRWIGYYE